MKQRHLHKISARDRDSSRESMLAVLRQRIGFAKLRAMSTASSQAGPIEASIRDKVWAFVLSLALADVLFDAVNTVNSAVGSETACYH
jgi:hypothetical protein